MCWNCFASGHGKGEVDGASTFLEHKIHKEQIKRQALQATKCTCCYILLITSWYVNLHLLFKVWLVKSVVFVINTNEHNGVIIYKRQIVLS
jgi:hypothetical protein